jgi:transcriptional regulator GlxA family with amidase domain
VQTACVILAFLTVPPVPRDRTRRGRALADRPQVIFLAANRDQPVYLSEICAATGVSETTLRRCCHEHLGMGPVRYLWLRRVSLVRSALMRADPTVATVTGIATDHGFWELGRFSVKYRALFGESPSATLRRPPDDRRRAKNRPIDLPVADFA